MPSPGGLGLIRLFVGGMPVCPGREGARALPQLKKDRLASLKQNPSQGLLIPLPAADHVNPGRVPSGGRG